MVLLYLAVAVTSRTVSEGSVETYDLSSAATKLAAELKAPIKVQKAIQGLHVLIRRRLEKPDVLLKGLASASDSTLEKIDGVWNLHRTKEDVFRLKLLDRKFVGDGFEALMKQWDESTKALDRSATPAQEAEMIGQKFLQIQKLENRYSMDQSFDLRQMPVLPNPQPYLPAGRLFRGIIKRLGIEAVTNLDPEEDVFYSNSPMADERALPEISDLLEAYQRQREQFRAQSLQTVSKEVWGELYGKIMDRSRVTPEPSLIKVVLKVHRDMSSIYCRLSCFDGDGNLLDYSGEASVSRGVVSTPAAEASGYFPDKKSKWEPLTVASRKFSDLFEEVAFDQPMRTRGVALKREQKITDVKLAGQILTSPDQIEPTGLVLPEALGGFVKEKSSGSFIAVVPDQVWTYALASVHDKRVNLGAFQFLAVKGGSRGPLIKVRDAGGITVIQPINPYLNEFFQADRRILGRFLRKVVNDGRMSLRTWALFHAGMGPAGTQGFVRQYTEKITLANPSFRNLGSMAFFRFLGAISDADWASLFDGKTVTVSSPLESLNLHSSVVDGDWKIGSKEPLSDLRRQPQYVYQETTDPAVPMHLELDSEQVARFWVGNKPDDPFGDPITISQIGERIGNMVGMLRRAHRRDRPNMTNSEALDELIKNSPLRFRTTERQHYTFIIGERDQVFLQKSFYEDGDLSDGFFTFADVPQDLLEMIRSAALEVASR